MEGKCCELYRITVWEQDMPVEGHRLINSDSANSGIEIKLIVMFIEYIAAQYHITFLHLPC